MSTTLAATYASLADALRTRHELQELRIPAEDISIAMRRGASGYDPDQPDVLTLGWLERAIAGWPSEPGDTNVAQALRRAGVHEQIAVHLAYDVDHGGVLIAAVVDAPALQESAELIMAKRARFADLVGESPDKHTERQPAPTREPYPTHAPGA